MEEKLFEYNPQTHTGTYKGKPLASVTQLVGVLYPLDTSIPQDRLESAAKRGTDIHDKVCEINKLFDNPYPFEENLKRAILKAKELGGRDLLDYVFFLSAYGLKPFDYENLVFVLDASGEPICYGHYDLVVIATKDITVDGVDLFKEGLLYLIDLKTVSEFDKLKTSFQCSAYKIGYEQMSKNLVEKTYGLHLREGIKLKPLFQEEKEQTIRLLSSAKKMWELQQ